MLDENAIRAAAANVVSKAKATARVDQGTLKRSIAYTYVKGIVTFRQIYYGEYRNNSQLEKLASQYMPRGVEYRIELTNESGSTVEIGRTKSGRRSQKSTIASIVQNNSSKIKALIAKVLNRGKKKD